MNCNQKMTLKEGLLIQALFENQCCIVQMRFTNRFQLGILSYVNQALRTTVALTLSSGWIPSLHLPFQGISWIDQSRFFPSCLKLHQSSFEEMNISLRSPALFTKLHSISSWRCHRWTLILILHYSSFYKDLKSQLFDECQITTQSLIYKSLVICRDAQVLLSRWSVHLLWED